MSVCHKIFHLLGISQLLASFSFPINNSQPSPTFISQPSSPCLSLTLDWIQPCNMMIRKTRLPFYFHLSPPPPHPVNLSLMKQSHSPLTFKPHPCLLPVKLVATILAVLIGICPSRHPGCHITREESILQYAQNIYSFQMPRLHFLNCNN